MNGPPGVGKSTVARLLAAGDRRALALDADVVVSMLSGWRDDFWGTLPVARRLAAVMAREHLAGGHDVFLPQLVTSEQEISPYLAAVQASSGADPVGRHVARDRRGRRRSPTPREVRALLDRAGRR